jgi:CheY-like chemotaxis protein
MMARGKSRTVASPSSSLPDVRRAAAPDYSLHVRRKEIGWSARHACRTTAQFMNQPGTILFAEDDENDAFIFRMALQKAEVRNALAHVSDGEDAINYLAGVGIYSDRYRCPLPCLVVTDLKMPRSTGFDLLAWINNQPASNRPPVVVLSGSYEDSDKERALALGAGAYFKKPAGMDKMVRIAQELKDRWLAPLSRPT